MAKAPKQIRKDRVAKARARIADGKYDFPAALDAMLSPRRLDRIIAAYDACPVGNGHAYRDLVSELFAKNLNYVVDVPLSRAEFRAGGGRGDIELPLRIEALADYPLWDRWAERYDIRSIIVETKNEKAQASVEDVSQLAGYFKSTKLGRFGILVARNGFSKSSLVDMALMARDGENLILPLDHDGLREFSKASRHGDSMEYLRRRETLLLQMA